MTHTVYLRPGSGTSFKPALVLRQTGRSCTVQGLDVLAGHTRRAEFLAVNRRGQAPYLVNEDRRGIPESNAIGGLRADGSAWMPAAPVARPQAATAPSLPTTAAAWPTLRCTAAPIWPRRAGSIWAQMKP
jgi:glutathione S-transferase